MSAVYPSPLKEAVTRHLLALVLLTVLVWHTVVVPAPAAPFARRGGRPRDAEGRDAEGAGGAGGPAAGGADPPAEDLDWPEFIGG